VIVEPSSASEAEAEASDLEKLGPLPSPQQRGKRRRKANPKANKREGWIWLESMTRGQSLGGGEKLAEYKNESEWH
jgi:hypothetical protein